ncbi:flagellar basal body-associated protein FliL [Rhodovulum sp. NI22]|nr:flagellar basal body-associated protein FliL [Rhodovulum sp. NI22]
MSKLLPLLIALVGLAAGTGAGIMLRPAPEAAAGEGMEAGQGAAPEKHAKAPEDVEFVKLNNQFVVPVVESGRVSALVVLALSLEVALGERANVYQLEPKLRDAFLQVLFDHANSGGFRGAFTTNTNMSALRMALTEMAQKVIGPTVSDVLIIDLVRQDT